MPTAFGSRCFILLALAFQSARSEDVAPAASVATCEYDAWGEWSACNVIGCTQMRMHASTANDGVCAGLTETQVAKCLDPSLCTGEVEEPEPAGSEDPTPLECVFGEWEEWSNCSSPCGFAVQERKRSAILQESADVDIKLNCSDLTEVETKMCEGLPECPKCVFDDWGQWSACSVECDGGFQKREMRARDQKPGEVLDPSAVTVSDDLHLDCIDIVKIEEEVCNVEPCQLKPIVAEGSSWFVSFLRFVFYFGVFVVCGLVAAVGWRWHKHKSYRDQYRNVGTSDDTTFEAHHL